MKTLMIPKPELKALQAIMKRSKRGLQEALKHLIIQEGAISATDGRILLRINKEAVPVGDFKDGVYEILKVIKTSAHMPAELILSRREDLSGPKMETLFNAKTAKGPEPFPLKINAEPLTLTRAIIKLFDRFKEAYSYELLETLGPLDREFTVSIVTDSGTLRLDNCNATALLMPFQLDNE